MLDLGFFKRMNDSTAIRLVTKYWSLWRKPCGHLLEKQLSSGDTEVFLLFCLVSSRISVFSGEKPKDLLLQADKRLCQEKGGAEGDRLSVKRFIRNRNP
ncbi:hypothetical protein VT98_10962 [Candidatus Electrothrix communis]|uniref:Uncharacterized protein n=1 Tax=Candidatus Electrothrix communis TaxID=1859133 RepID=A0A3S3RBN5_9BACT|nr:hypothetical protein VT98_10962 [Candidatus Electrothrix communis]